jgi:membrane fusion protein (multidrug efflux system)
VSWGIWNCPGSFVHAGAPLFTLVETREVWVDANFKETDLPRIEPGQPAEVQIDLLPGESFQGRVESLSPASGTAFSLLPPENATGNWVKVTQRF